jgi:AcrR family transcriptional regulator
MHRTVQPGGFGHASVSNAAVPCPPVRLASMVRREISRRAPHQLPSGRHGLPRALVVSNQRRRILQAVLEVVSANGYACCRVADVIAVAGVSRRTFYDHFANKEEAFLAAYDMVVAELGATVEEAFGSGDSWPERVCAALDAFLRYLAQGPALAHVCVVEVLAAGPSALERRRRAMERFRAFLIPDELAPSIVALPPALVAEAVVGGLYEVVYGRVLAEQTADLPVLLSDLLHAILAPFLGPDMARSECKRLVGDREAV